MERKDIPSLGDLPGGLELIGFRGGLDDVLPVGHDDIGTAVGELGGDELVRVRRGIRLHDDGVIAADSGGVDTDELWPVQRKSGCSCCKHFSKISYVKRCYL